MCGQIDGFTSSRTLQPVRFLSLCSHDFLRAQLNAAADLEKESEKPTLPAALESAPSLKQMKLVSLDNQKQAMNLEVCPLFKCPKPVCLNHKPCPLVKAGPGADEEPKPFDPCA
jgi:hypothetical protein